MFFMMKAISVNVILGRCTEMLLNFIAPKVGWGLTSKICGSNKMEQWLTLQETKRMFSGKYKLAE
jgi:hypothetical protein